MSAASTDEEPDGEARDKARDPWAVVDAYANCDGLFSSMAARDGKRFALAPTASPSTSRLAS